LPIKNRDGIRDQLTMQIWSHGFCAGGVSTIGGLGLGFAGAAPGAGLTSIGGGNGAACWLTAAGGRDG